METISIPVMFSPLSGETGHAACDGRRGSGVLPLAIKASLAYSAVHRLAESLGAEAELQVKLGDSVDHRAAVAAFLAKQAPVFIRR